MLTSEQHNQKLVGNEKNNKVCFRKKKPIKPIRFFVFIYHTRVGTLTRVPGVYNLQEVLIRKHSLQKKTRRTKKGLRGTCFDKKKTEYTRVRPPYLRFRSAAAAPLR